MGGKEAVRTLRAETSNRERRCLEMQEFECQVLN